MRGLRERPEYDDDDDDHSGARGAGGRGRPCSPRCGSHLPGLNALDGGTALRER